MVSQIDDMINILGNIGRTEYSGLYRASYTNDEYDAIQQLLEWVKSAGMSGYRDSIGNLWGRVDGHLTEGKSIVVGSHIDTVKNGGKFDGAYGIIAGLLAIKDLIQNHGKPNLPLELVAFTGEEASRFPISLLGSKGVVGNLDRETLDQVTDNNKITVAEAMKIANLDPDKFYQAKRNDIEVFIEPHIDQGRTLKDNNVPIGIVISIVSIRLVNVTVEGRADHAGVVPMHDRKDALLGAADMISNIGDFAKSLDNGVMTVGGIEAHPNCSNVISEKVKFSIDARNESEPKLQEMLCRAKNICDNVAFALDLNLKWELKSQVKPVKMSKKLIELIQQSCIEEKLPYMEMPSFAGHDSMSFANNKIPTCMFFIPCNSGRSHSPDEYATKVDMETGVNLLKRMLLKLAY